MKFNHPRLKDITTNILDKLSSNIIDNQLIDQVNNRVNY